MGKKKQKQESMFLTPSEATELQVNYMTELETNPQYSLLVDPEDKYKLPDAQKDFIKYYIDFKNVNTAADLAGIDMDLAKQYFKAYATQTEIRRINLALYHRQFSSKLVTIDQLGGYLSSLLTNQYVPLAEQLTTNEKLRVVDMLIRLNDMKNAGLANPDSIMTANIDIQLKNLSVKTIQELLKQKPTVSENAEIIDANASDLTMEEKAYLETLPTEDLLKLIDDTTKVKAKRRKDNE